MNVLAVLGLGTALALWTVGLWTVLPEPGMAALLALTLTLGVAAWLTAWRAPTRRRLFPQLAGTLALGAAAAYLLALFTISGGEVPVTRRAPEPDGEVAAVRLVDFNVLHGYPGFVDLARRYRRLADALAALEPTVVVLQEAWSVTGHGVLVQRLGDELGFDVAYARANGSRRLLGFEEGSAVLSRLPILRARRVVLAPRRPLWESRIALVVEIGTGPGETLAVVAVHLTHRDLEVAHRQARDLVTRLAPHELAIVAGDLNAPSGSAVVEVFEELGFEDVVPGGIDHVLVSAGGPWRVASAGWTLRPRELAELIGEDATISDHPGIVVELRRVNVRTAAGSLRGFAPR